MALKEPQYVTGYQTSDGIIHQFLHDATDHERKIEFVEWFAQHIADRAACDRFLEMFKVPEVNEGMELWPEPEQNSYEPPEPKTLYTVYKNGVADGVVKTAQAMFDDGSNVPGDDIPF